MPAKKEKTTDLPETLHEAVTFFSDPDRCIQWLSTRRWPDGEVKCPTCDSSAVIYLKNQRRWKCSNDHEKRQFSIKVGTIMEDSPIGLDKWLVAMWMICNAKNGISSYEIHRALGVTQKTAWFLLHRIRLAMHGDSEGKLGSDGGPVEADETYVGGKARFMHKSRKGRKIKGRGTAGKTAVMGLLDRHGKDGVSQVRTRVVTNTDHVTLHPIVRANVESGATLNTDEHGAYRGLEAEYVHNVINHGEKYVDGAVYTNGIENFWTLLKRSIKGTYVSVEPFHLFRYVDEQAFRFNERGGDDLDRFAHVVERIVGKRITYKTLIGEAPLEPTIPASV